MTLKYPLDHDKTDIRYLIPAEPLCTSIEVKRSRFIASATHTPSRENSRAFIEQIRTQFSDANHNCWACVIGSPGTSSQTGMSDDGEPRGAAGKPMLTALLHADIGDITVVVSRYFGGIKLGKGGMARAYTDALLNALERMPRQQKISYRHLSICLEYPLHDVIEKVLLDYEVAVDMRNFGTAVNLQIRVPTEHCTKLKQHLTELSKGRIQIKTAD